MTLVSESIGQFFTADHRLEYTEYGSGDRWVVLVPGHLMPRSMHHRLARSIAASGAHVVTLDPLGHGRSDRSADPLQYSITAAAEHVLGLLDQLGVEAAILGGTSLGANVALEAAAIAPHRVRGLLLEAPVLENGVEACMLTSGPLLFAARYAPLAVVGVRVLAQAVPRGLVPFWVGVGLDALAQRPAAMAASLHGRFFGRLAPSSAERMALEVPALVVGIRRDPLHPQADARMLAEELTAAQFVAARGALEWRLRPSRLDQAAVEFVAACWDQPSSGRLAEASS